MVERAHILLDPTELEQLRRLATRDGKSVSDWLLALTRCKVAAEAKAAQGLGTAEALRGFFEECDRRERGQEPDWQEHRDRIARSPDPTGS